MGNKQLILVACTILGAWLPSNGEPVPGRPGATVTERHPQRDTLVTRGAGGTPAVGESLSLRSAIHLALNHNPRLRTTGWELQRAEARRQQARLLPNPEVEIEAENIGAADGASGFDAAETTLALASRDVQRRRAVIDLHAGRVRLAAMWGSLEPRFESVVGEWDALSAYHLALAETQRLVGEERQ